MIKITLSIAVLSRGKIGWAGLGMGPGEATLRGVPGGNGDAAPGRSKGNGERQLLFKGCKRGKEGHQEMIDITYYDCLQTVHHREVS